MLDISLLEVSNSGTENITGNNICYSIGHNLSYTHTHANTTSEAHKHKQSG